MTTAVTSNALLGAKGTDMKLDFEQRQEAARLSDSVADDPEGAAHLIVGLKAQVDALRDQLSADEKRLRFLAYEFDAFGGVDLHEQAAVYASTTGREEPNDDDYLAAMRDAVDAAISNTPNA